MLNASRAIILLLLPLLLTGCGDQRLAQLEKQNEELKAQINRRNAAQEYDLQEKCSKDADFWFRKHFAEDKGTILLTFTNHYNKAMNKCFIVVENHSQNGPQTLEKSAWNNDMSLWDVYENNRYGSFLEQYSYGLKIAPQDTVLTCELFDEKCANLNQWNNLTQSYMNS